MPENNPYQAPTSDLAREIDTQTYQPKLFTTKGRIGRLRFLAFNALLYLTFLISIILIVSVGSLAASSGSIFQFVPLTLLVALYVINMITAKRRLNDLNQSSWICLVLIIPIINLFVGILLSLMPGTRGANKYGAMPNKNPLWVKIVGFGIPVIVISGIIAGLTIPAYQDYLMRAN